MTDDPRLANDRELPLLESIRQCAQTLAEEAKGHRRIGVEEILNAVAQLACTFRTREIVLNLSPTTCEQLDKIMMAINPKLAAQSAEERARFLEWLESQPF